MPELPEVETTRRGIAPLLVGLTVTNAVLRTEKLRWPLDSRLPKLLSGRKLLGLKRRAKYLLFEFTNGTLLLHLGMSGSLRVLSLETPPGRHDHADIHFSNGSCLRLTDPRKFGALLWVEEDPFAHPLLGSLGPEPLDDEFDGVYLYTRSRRRKLAVKSYIMDQKLVVGVGNIYASEALFRSGIRPDRPAGGLSKDLYRRLAAEIKLVLASAIEAGGTTLQDFKQADGRPGYFKQELNVYGRAGEDCPSCGRPIQVLRIGQRSTYFCRRCQR